MRLLLIAALLIGATAPAQSRPARARTGQIGEAEASIRSQLARWVADVNAGRQVASNQIWSDQVIGWYPGQPDFTYDNVRRNIAKGDRPPRPNWRIELEIDEVIVDRNLAVVRDRWRQYERAEMAAAWKVTDDIRSFEVWQRGARGWKIVRWISAPEKLPDASGSR